MALAKLALTAASLASRGNADVMSLMASNTAMLKALSRQLDVIQDGIAKLHIAVNDLNRAILRLPERTVIEGIRSRIGAVRVAYRTFTEAVEVSADQMGPTMAFERHKGRINATMLERLRGETDQIFGTYANPGLTPVIAEALMIEWHMLTILGEDGDFLEARLRAYENWARAMLNPSRPGSIGSDLAANLAARPARLAPENLNVSYNCNSSGIVIRSGGNALGSRSTQADIDTQFEAATIHLGPFQQPAAEQVVQEMIDTGLFKREERPQHATPDFHTPARQTNHKFDPNVNPGRLASLRALPACNNRDNWGGWRNSIATRAAAVADAEAELALLVSLRHSAESILSFSEQIRMQHARARNREKGNAQ